MFPYDYDSPSQMARATGTLAMQPARKLVDPAPHLGLTLEAVLRTTRQVRSSDVILRAPADAEGASEAISYARLEERVQKLAAFLSAIRAPARSVVLIAAPLSAEAMVAALGALRAGLTPALLPATLTASEFARRIDTLGAPVAIGVDRVGEIRPLVALRDAAVRSFHLRLLAGFGAEMPEGVASLETIFAAPAAPGAPPAGEAETCLLVPGGGGAADTLIGDALLIEASLEVARALRPTPNSRIVTTMVGGDLAAWATSLGAAALAGLEVAPLGLFSLQKLWASLSDGVPVHLVAPAALEAALEASGLARHKAIASLVYVHAQEPPRSDRPATLGPAIVDVTRLAADRIAVRRR